MTLRTMSSREVLVRAIGKEEEAYFFYELYAGRFENSGSKILLEELAEEELKHKETLKNLDEKKADDFPAEKIQDVHISDFLMRGPMRKDANIQSVLTYAIKEEEDAQRFYSLWVGYVADETVSRILKVLAQEELKHKVRLERMYEDIFLPES